MSKPAYTIRDYRPGDEKQIVGLNTLVFGPMKDEYWRWRYLGNPYGKSIIKVMFDRDELIGQFALQPFDFDLHGNRVRGCFALDAMTHPDHRGRGVFTAVGRQGMADARTSGYALGYAFLNSNSHPGFTTKLGWHTYGNKMELFLNLKESKKIRAQGDVRFSERIPLGTERLWDLVKSELDIVGVPRDSRFLKWRFAAESGWKYQFAECFNGRGDLVGYAATKVYKNQTGHVIDLLADGRDTAETLLFAAIERFRDAGLQEFSCWLPPKVAHGLRVEGLAERTNPRTFFVSVNLLQPAANPYDEGAWYMTMADSDVY